MSIRPWLWTTINRRIRSGSTHEMRALGALQMLATTSSSAKARDTLVKLWPEREFYVTFQSSMNRKKRCASCVSWIRPPIWSANARRNKSSRTSGSRRSLSRTRSTRKRIRWRNKWSTLQSSCTTIQRWKLFIRAGRHSVSSWRNQSRF